MIDKPAILGTTVLEWHGVDDTPEMCKQEYEGESWLRSEPLLLLDTNGQIAMGYCHKSADKEKEFEIISTQIIGPICAWALIGKIRLPGVG